VIASQRTRTRLLLRDGAALSAFGSVALSGAVPSWALLAFAIAFAISLTNRRPLAGRTGWSVAVLLLAALLIFGSVFRGGLDLVIAAVSFAALVTAHRLLSEPTPSTDHQVHLTSLLTLAGGAALTGELWFGLCLALFAITSTLSIGLLVLEGPRPIEGDLPVQPALQRLGLGVCLALLGGILFFVLFPRLSWNLAARRASPGLGGGTTGMSDRVRLGGGGDIKTSPRIVLRAKLIPDPGVEQLDQYWVGRTFDRFDGREWSGSGAEARPRWQVFLDEASGGTVQQNIELLPAYGARTLVGLQTPVMFSNATMLVTSGSQRTPLVKLEDEEVHFADAANAYTYTAFSRPADVRGVVTELADIPRFTRLPATIDPRVEPLARQVLAGERNPQAAGSRLAEHLKRNYGYTLELPGDVADPLADFLFVRKEGHCEHFATALAVLLRSQGFAARVVAGFFGGERIGGLYVVRAGDAHAWTQVFVPGRGWATLDATPDTARSAQSQAVLQWFVTRYEQLEDWWRSRVVDYSFQDQIDLARSLVRPPRSTGPDADGSEPRGFSNWPPRRAWFSAAAVGLLVFLMMRVLSRRTSGKHHPAVGFLEQLERALRRAGIARLEGEAIEELAARLQSSQHPLAPAVARATRAYLFARFGGQPMPAEERSRLIGAIRPASR